MRYMSIVKSSEKWRAEPPPQALMDAIGKMAEAAMKDGLMVGMGGLLPTEAGARVTLSGGKMTVIDGPFTEAKEVVGGYAIFEFRNKEEALASAVEFMQLHRQHMPGWEGTCEVRAMAGPEDTGCQAGQVATLASA